MSEALLYTKWIKESFVKCTACNHFCQIPNWKSWICWIRANFDWKLYLLTYWKALWVNVDPIEKKPLFHVLPWDVVFSFWTAWCNFSCTFCQNWQMSQIKATTTISKSDNDGRIYVSAEKLQTIWHDLLPSQIVKFCLTNWIKAIAYTYNEPTVFFEYAYDCMKLTRSSTVAEKIKNSNLSSWEIDANIINFFVTNGYESDYLWNLADWYLDAVNIDLKSFSEEFYKKYVWAKLEVVLENIKKVYEKYHFFMEVTTLIIPGENDSDELIKQTAKFIKDISPDIPWHISAFHPDWKMLNKPITPVETLQKAYEIWKNEWLNYVYIWNVNLPEYETTYCPKCNKDLIIRSGYVGENVAINYVDDGMCPSCKTKIPWIFIKDGKYIVRKQTLFS